MPKREAPEAKAAMRMDLDNSAVTPSLVRRAATFPTAIGDCGVAWLGGELTHVLLPAADGAATRSLLAHLSGAAVESVAADAGVDQAWPDFVRDAVRAMQTLIRGEAVSLAGVPLAWSRVGAFERRVYEATQRLGPGETSSYGEIARALGAPEAARAVGVALGRNPWPLVVPCHRVLAAGGKLGGFSAPGGVATKEKLLAIEAPLRRRDGELF
jgi:methylated-DNA-[protein]-cysteine S-methyltransferase